MTENQCQGAGGGDGSFISQTSLVLAHCLPQLPACQTQFQVGLLFFDRQLERD